MDKSKDINAWKAFKQGDKSALEDIYRNHVRALYRYGAKFTPSKEIVEDAIQDLFIELWQNRANLADTDSVGKYLFVALRRKVIQIIQRKEKKYISGEIDTFFLHLEDEKKPDERLDNPAEQKMVNVKSAVDDLSARQKEAIYLKYFAGMDNEEIGYIMEVNDQSVRNLLSRALKALRKSLLGMVILLLFGLLG